MPAGRMFDDFEEDNAGGGGARLVENKLWVLAHVAPFGIWARQRFPMLETFQIKG